MASTNSVTTLDGLFKEVYSAEGIQKLVPDAAILTKMVKFDSKEEQGGQYIIPIVLSGEQGVSYAAAGDGAFSINNSVAATMKKAKVDGAQLVVAGAIDYESAAKASKGGKKSFLDATELLVQNLIESGTKRLEISFLYGQSGIGTVSSLASQVITLTAASFAPGIWSGMENALIDVYTSAGAVRQANLTITSVDLDNRTITVSGTTTGIVATDVIYFQGSFGKECVGLDKIITNTSSLFNIDASAYNLWKGNIHTVSSVALTMAAIQSAVAKAVNKGLNEDVVCLVNPKTWQNINSDQSALRNYTDDKEEAKNGFNKISFRGLNGKIDIVASPYCKEGEAFIFPPKKLKRVGATDLTFQTPGRDEELFLQMPSNAGYQLRMYANQSIFCLAPSKCVKITGIVNS